MQKLAPVLTGASLLRYRSRESVLHYYIGFPQGALNRNPENWAHWDAQPETV